MKRTHELKTDPNPFEDVRNGLKTFELRFNDRGFRVGDTLVLRQTDFTAEEMRAGKPLVYTGEVERAEVIHILRGPAYGLQEGWVIMSIEPERCI